MNLTVNIKLYSMDKFEKNKLLFWLSYPEYTNKLYNFNKKQKGGQNLIKTLYEGKYYNFDYIYEESIGMYMFYDSKNEYQCVVILVYRDDKNAIIQNINGDYPNCPNGSKILKVSIKFLKENKSKLGIKRILLQDNSIKKCNGFNIEFWAMYTLLYRKTWYESHGFLPYNQNENSVNNFIMARMHDNYNVMKNAYVGNIKNFGKYASNELKIQIIKKLKEQPNIKLHKFVHWLLSVYDVDRCRLFYNIYEKFIFDIKIYPLRKIMYTYSK